MAIAEKLASCGCHVIIADLGKPPAPEEPLKTATGEEMEAIAAELAKIIWRQDTGRGRGCYGHRRHRGMVETIKGAFDHIDILCNNAGASFGVPEYGFEL